MNLRTENFSISELTEEDVKGILEVYNSNQDFLLSHMERREVSVEWLRQEIEEMKKANFKTLIVKENINDTVIGFIDFSPMEECYLSLLMVHSLYRSKGYGKEIYDEFENYTRIINAKRIRIDAVYNYNKEVLQFWENRGFNEIEEIQLKWSDKLLDAIVMKKNV
ncbi:GNAT family N-acetyltransferase [Alkaliphilus peptidifermentans]|uniref:Ribosomal protein S18 acetylase RimI n=1 Tax=Alkaliphilus peptidifermentans DSM 18978 TaxID=1120976 RepID=A0A1G5LFB4_9FIRM|nr:GNAT family N-acetyltransferase [Alkaliphilus peptidifermentans]SCZ11171.1 Ribosomal protein S18 acetylase RimI [Alkaliphilus peptidifermentans DSM 18978]